MSATTQSSLMRCGPARFRVDPRAQPAQRGFEHFVEERRTSFRLPAELQAPGTSMPAIFAALSKDEQRNTRIIDDVLAAVEVGRNPLVLTERRDHLEYLAARFKGAARNITVLRGGLICVYTYDVDDERDCLRVRLALRNLGVTWKIPYKTDADTYAGKYAKNGVRVSKRYE